MPFQKLQPRRGSMLLYIVLLVVALGLMLSARQCSISRIGLPPDMTAGGDTLNVAIEISPTSLSLAGDTLSGAYYNLLRQTCVSHNLPVRFHPYTRLEDALQWLSEGRCRLIVGDLPVTAELRDSLIFLNPVGVDKQVLVQLRDSSAVQTQFDLGGRTVHLPAGSPYIQRLRNLSHEIGDTIYITEDPEYSSEQLVLLTALGEIPLAVVNSETASALKSRYPRLDTSVEISLNQFQSWALSPRDSLLRDSLNLWLSR